MPAAVPDGAVNQVTRRFEMVNKPQRYLFTEADGSESFDDSFVVRTCDMSDYRAGTPGAMDKFAQELGESLTEIGFAVLTGHGVDPALFAPCDRAVRHIFERSLDQKQAFTASRPAACSVNQGYFGKGETSGLTADLVEGWVLTRRAFGLQAPCGPRGQHASVRGGGVDREGLFLPADCAYDQHVLTEYVRAMEALPRPIVRAMLHYLGDSNVHRLDAALTCPSIGLRLNYYPAISAAEDASGAGRLLGHEDVTLITLLPAPSEEGLQLLNRRTGAWVRLQAPPGSIILNSGDYFQRISADRFPSTTHRVSKPRALQERRRARVTFPLNVYLWEDEVLQVLPHLQAMEDRGEDVERCGYGPIRAQVFHTAITEKYYGDDADSTSQAARL